MMQPNGKYTQTDIDNAARVASDQTATRVRLIIGQEQLEKAMERLERIVSAREGNCQAKWRKDILYFAGVPGVILTAVLLVANWSKLTGG